MIMIRAEQLTKTFGDVLAVNGLSFCVREGEIFGLVGPDGAGKTTTIRMLAGILEPTRGDAWVGGYHVLHQAEALKPLIGYMSQHSGLYGDLTVMENLQFFADIHDVPPKQRTEAIQRLLAFINLAPFRRRLAAKLSGGMKQKLALACALVHSPRVLLLDEPTSGVDPVSRRDFWRLLSQLLRARVTVLLSTAYLDEAERCHHLGLIHQGRLLATGTAAELRQLMPGSLLEIRTPNLRQAAQILRQALPPDSVTLFGDRLHIHTPTPEQHVTDIQSRLAAAGIAVASVRKVEPSLEDIFVTVLDRPAGSPPPHQAESDATRPAASQLPPPPA